MNAQRTVNRILVALDPSRKSQSVLELATALAARLDADLLALFVEDVNLIHLAGLPFAREVDRILVRERDIDLARIERALRSQVDHIQRVLAQLAGEFKVRSSLQVVRGYYLAEALSAATAMDAIVFGGTEFGVSRARSKTPPPATQALIGVVYDGSVPGEHALVFARDMATAEGCDLAIFLIAAETENRQAARESMQNRVGGKVSVHCVTAMEEALSSFARMTRKGGGHLLVMPRDHDHLLDLVIKGRLNKMGCPVVLVP
jgi:hypothetical protein